MDSLATEIIMIMVCRMSKYDKSSQKDLAGGRRYAFYVTINYCSSVLNFLAFKYVFKFKFKTGAIVLIPIERIWCVSCVYEWVIMSKPRFWRDDSGAKKAAAGNRRITKRSPGEVPDRPICNHDVCSI